MGGGGSSRDCFAFSDSPKSFDVALSNLGVAPKVGEAGVAVEVDEIAPLCTINTLKMSRISVVYSSGFFLRSAQIKAHFIG